MAILLVATDRDVSPLQNKIRQLLAPSVDVWVYPAMPDPAAVEMVVLWKHPADLLSRLPNLGLISSLGAGVEHILNDPRLPVGVPIVRIVDEALTVSMRSYALMCVLNIHRQFLWYVENQRQGVWRKPERVEIPLRIGVLGLGELGRDIARSLANLGFDVRGYSRHPKEIEGVECFDQQCQSLTEFVSSVNTLICLLPATPDTRGVLNYELLRRLPPGSHLINVARGVHLVEDDLLRAMREGYVQTAFLDVFHEEPLPPDHPFWTQPGVVVTPHIASVTNQDNAAAIIADNYQRWQTGRPLRFAVDREQGY